MGRPWRKWPMGPPNYTLVKIRGNVNGIDISLNIAAEGGATVEKLKAIVQKEKCVRTGAYFLNARLPDGTLCEAPADKIVAVLPQSNGAIDLVPTATGR